MHPIANTVIKGVNNVVPFDAPSKIPLDMKQAIYARNIERNQMCKSIKEGGMRCDSHIEEAKVEAKEWLDRDPSPKNRASYEKALKEYVLTGKYVEELLADGKTEEAQKAERNQWKIAPRRKLFSLAVQERMKLARNPETSESLQAMLTGDSSFNVRMELAKSSHNVKVLNRLAEDKDTRVSVWVARNPHTHPKTLTKMFMTGGDQHLMGIASNPNCPTSLYEALANLDVNFANLKSAIAKKEDCPLSLLEQLANSKRRWLQEAVSRHPRYIEAHSQES